jgi:hypothetical protein
MNFGSLLAALGLAAVKAEARLVARRVGRRLAVAIATGVLVLTAAGFALAAFAVWLAGEVGTIEALALIAVGLIVIALLVQAIAWLANRPGEPIRRRRTPPPPPLADSLGAADSDAPPPGSALGSVAVVGLVGFLLGRQLFRRRR